MTSLADAARDLAARTRREQGLQEHIEDLIVLDRLAQLVDAAGHTAPHLERTLKSA